jgi:hypothetical protein
MPATYSIDPQRRLVHSVASGVLTIHDVAEHYRLIRADPAFDPSFCQLADLRAVERIDLDPGALRSEALAPIFAPMSRRAFVGSSDVQFGMARMYGIYSEGAQQLINVFRDLDRAMDWLGLDGPVGSRPGPPDEPRARGTDSPDGMGNGDSKLSV